MGAEEIDNYLAGLEEPAASSLAQLRRDLLSVIPKAEQGLSYGLPAFRIDGKTVAGFGAFSKHLSYLPHSGSVLPMLAADLRQYGGTKSSLHFPLDEPLPRELVRKLIEARIAQLRPPAGE